MQVANRFVAILVAASDRYDIIASLFIAMLRNGIAGRIMLIRIPVGSCLHPRRSVSEIP